MKKNVISGFCAGVVMILLSWILGISIPSVVAVIVATLVFFCVTGFVLVDNWKKWGTLAWYYWVIIILKSKMPHLQWGIQAETHEDKSR